MLLNSLCSNIHKFESAQQRKSISIGYKDSISIMRVLDWRKSWTPLALVLFLSGFNLVLELEQTQSKMARTAVGSRRVCFLTDVEGNWGYVRNFVRQSTCLRFAANEEAVPTSGGRPADHDDDEELELNDDCFLVYGGDVGDKGGETLQ